VDGNGNYQRAVVTKTLDGFGRTVKVETGNGSTTVSIVETEYDSCGCSPFGKTKRATMPRSSGGAQVWTTFNYDGLGRTVSEVAWGGATKIYQYVANTVKATDEAGKWKKYWMDAFGNLTKVEEPNRRVEVSSLTTPMMDSVI